MGAGFFIHKEYDMRRWKLIPGWAALILAACANPARGGPGSAKGITAFSVAGTAGAINAAAKTVDVVLPRGTDLSGLSPSITVSAGASVTPSSGAAQDFSGAVSYTVTAADGSAAVWTVKVRWAPLTADTTITGYLTSPPSNAGDGTDVDPIILPLDLDLSGNGWSDLLTAISGKYVALDLTECTIDGTEFDPDNTVSAGKKWIVSLTLPAEAKSVKAGTFANPAFANFVFLKEVYAAAVTTVGDYAFSGCTALETASFPAVTSIEDGAFSGCAALETASFPAVTSVGDVAFENCEALETASFPAAASIGEQAFSGCAVLETASFPAVTSIGEDAFYNTGSKALTVTLGSTAPALGEDMFAAVSETKPVIVKVPSGAAGYGTTPADTTTLNWGNVFRGKGWNSTDGYGSGTVNSKIELTIQYQ
jgi:hypothetical protein